MNFPIDLTDTINQMVKNALAEDVGSGDLTAALLPEKNHCQATIVAREAAIICGTAWVDEVYRQLSSDIIIQWHVQDSDAVQSNQIICSLSGNTRNILTGERTALNFLQTLSATATTTSQFISALENSTTQLLDTRKTIPGMRLAQKYAVKCGGGHNHRMGLYDAFLIKENHIIACGSITKAVTMARSMNTHKLIEIEVENLDELTEALTVHADIIMLDNFSLAQIQEAVMINAGKAKLEVSGGVDLATIHHLAETGVDFISVGALTKHIRAIDLSLRIK